MPCYSYNSNNPITFVGNVEITLPYTGIGNYSFSTLAWICEFPLADQLKVYGVQGIGEPTEYELIINTDYTIDELNSRVVVINNSFIFNGLIIRRTTPSNRMIYKFTDGAKLTARELNASFHQLLFLNQERDFLGGTNIHNYYPVFQNMAAWVNGTSYVPGNFVTYNSSIYKCILATNSINPSDATYWTLISNQMSAFVVMGGPNPVVFNFTNLSPGKAIVWDGNQFTAQSFTSSLATLTDVNLTGVAPGDLLKYSSGIWVKATPSIQDITAQNLVFNDRSFYGLASNLSYTNNGSSIDVTSKTILLPFKSGSNWVLTDPPTVYHILKNTIPSSADPQTFFTQIRSELDGLAANVTNPVKMKFFWNLNEGRLSVADTAGTGDNLDNYKAYFWDSYGELYNTTGYATANGLKSHGVDGGANLHKVSPYFYENRVQSTGLQVSYVSKLKGYGVKQFYLSVPECYTTCLANLPAATSSSSYFTSTTNASLLASLNAVGGDNEAGFPHRDLYLMGLRDMAFAAARPTPGATALAGTVVKDRDAKVRYLKGAVLFAEYTNLGDGSFIRFEDPDAAPGTVLWKIPRHIIYYNKAALVFANKDNGAHDSNGSFNKDTVRFEGYNSFQGDYTNAGTFPDHNSSSDGLGQGTLFKANHYWSTWCSKWVSDVGVTTDKYRFNEADIDWYLYNMIDAASNIGLYKTAARNPPVTHLSSGSFGAGNETSQQGYQFFPWAFRPNDPRVDFSSSVGTLQFNIDANKLFSQATNFLPDPEDEYVFRLIASDSLTPLFQDEGFSSLKTATILEYGFSEADSCSSSTPLTSNLQKIFPRGSFTTDRYRADSRIDFSKIRVYVKREAMETTGSGASEKTRYVITLGIRVPRIKSIGYAKVFRNMYLASVVTSYPERNAAVADAEIDSGPWSWGSISPQRGQNEIGMDTATAENEQGDRLTHYSNPPTNVGSAKKHENLTWGLYSSMADTFHVYEDNAAIDYAQSRGPVDNWISGRNECAVKFTRVGIPSTLWIKLSVLNTDGSVDLLNSSGFINVAG